MNRSDGPVADLDEATDQLVDEIGQRVVALDELLDTSIIDTGLSLEEIRRHAAEVVERLTDRKENAVAVLVTRALWPTQPGADVPAWWWATPLGTLISAARRRSSDSALERAAMNEQGPRVPAPEPPHDVHRAP